MLVTRREVDGFLTIQVLKITLRRSNNVVPLFKKVDHHDTLKGIVLKTSYLQNKIIEKWCSWIVD